MLNSITFLPVLAEIEPGQVFFVIVLLLSAAKSIYDSRKQKEEPKRRRRRPTRPPEEVELPFPVFVEELPTPEPQQALPVEALAPLTVPEGREQRQPLGVDLDKLDASLPSRQEGQFESHKLSERGAEGWQVLEPIQSLSTAPPLGARKGLRVSAASLRRAIVMAEVLGSPVALRKDSIACHPR